MCISVCYFATTLLVVGDLGWPVLTTPILILYHQMARFGTNIHGHPCTGQGQFPQDTATAWTSVTTTWAAGIQTPILTIAQMLATDLLLFTAMIGKFTMDCLCTLTHFICSVGGGCSLGSDHANKYEETYVKIHGCNLRSDHTNKFEETMR